MEIIEKELDSSYDNGFTIWHSHKEYKLNNTKIKITDSVGGCGMQQLYGWYGYENNSEIKDLVKYAMNNLHNGTSCVICQVGSDFYASMITSALEDYGFFISKEYKNLQHMSDDTQRLYMYIVNTAKIDE